MGTAATNAYVHAILQPPLVVAPRLADLIEKPEHSSAAERMRQEARARMARWAASTGAEAESGGAGAAQPPPATCMPPLVVAPRLPQIANVPSSNVQPSPKGPPSPLAPVQPYTPQSSAQTVRRAPNAPTRKRKNGGRAKDPEKVPSKYRGPCCHGIKEWGVKESDGPEVGRREYA